MKILVVDNDEIACEYLVQTLTELGTEAYRANNGEDAVQKALQAHNSEHSFDIVLLDWKMSGMDGVQTARSIRQNVDTKLPILIVSAYDWSDIEHEALQAGIDGFLQKPLFKSTLCSGIQRSIHRQHPQNIKKPVQSLNGKCILLVEDNLLNREIAVELLSSMEAHVETAADGAIGISKFGESSEGYYDLIFMDVQMPNVNGYDATRKIRSMPRKDAASISIIAMTADAFAEDIETAKRAGMNSHLSKPFSMESLSKEIHKYL